MVPSDLAGTASKPTCFDRVTLHSFGSCAGCSFSGTGRLSVVCRSQFLILLFLFHLTPPDAIAVANRMAHVMANKLDASRLRPVSDQDGVNDLGKVFGNVIETFELHPLSLIASKTYDPPVLNLADGNGEPVEGRRVHFTDDLHGLVEQILLDRLELGWRERDILVLGFSYGLLDVGRCQPLASTGPFGNARNGLLWRAWRGEEIERADGEVQIRQIDGFACKVADVH
jgi:hypothetical protein